MTVRIATFNAENLMARFDFSGWRQDRRRDRTIAMVDVESEKEYKALERARVIAHADDARQMTALAIADCAADIVCLQEVEDLHTLEAFEDNYLERMTGLTYPHKIWRQGNDGRGIDVALMARERTADGREIEIVRVKSHRKSTFKDLDVHTRRLAQMGYEPHERVFRRDCLEVDLRIGGKMLTLFVCHFKSMGSSKEDGVSGRDYTMPVRFAEAQGVRRIVERKFGTERAPDMRWMICGDLNDYRERLVVSGSKSEGYRFNLVPEPTSGLEPLFTDGFAMDLVQRRSGDNRWTLYYAAGGVSDLSEVEERELRHLVQLDYFMASPALASKNGKAVPEIIRMGQPYRTVFPPHQDVPRYPRTGWDRPKASDHCPVVVSLKML
ncbi:endonuclease/exonuclease/phosphatase family protein [Pseudahrensia aquimaris]|uniref:Endonuclease/exonuclease/phosphatase family protein n=1 Tax=Pseudahrensia aquimaris TaxID=744461 RepID=A0ABW3FGT6_9HYPH